MRSRTSRFVPILTAALMVVTLFGAPLVARGAAPRTSTIPDDILQPTFSISRSGNLTATEARRMVAAVESAGADGHIVRYGSIGMTRHMRGADVLERFTANWRVPLATMVVPVEYVRDLGGERLAQVADSGELILGRKAADIRGAEVGDVLVLRDRSFRPHGFVVGAIVEDPIVNWNEVMMADTAATVLGTVDIARVSITDVPSYRKVVEALATRGFVSGTTYRFRHSWDPESPDGTLGLASTKKLLGEFAYKPAGGSAIRIAAGWLSANIEWSHRFTGIPLRFNCNKRIVGAVQGALDEIVAVGLSERIDVRNSNRYGGCYVGRYNRRGGSFGSPSRHAWGMAIDLNTTTNVQGGVPHMDCGVVRIFRKWGFAWGGNFWPADGMHFEWVGEARDTTGYASKYCRNAVPVPTTTLPQFGFTTTTSSTPSTSSTVAPSSTTTTPITSST